MVALRRKSFVDLYAVKTTNVFHEEVFQNGLLSAKSVDGKHTVVRTRKKKRPALQNLNQVIVHSGELCSKERMFIVDKVRAGLLKIGPDLGEFAGWVKDLMDTRLGPEWQCVVGTGDGFGTCLAPRSGCYLNFSIGDFTIIIFKAESFPSGVVVSAVDLP